MDQLREFYKLITPKADDEIEPLQEQLQAASEHIVNFLEGSPKPVIETTCILLSSQLRLTELILQASTLTI